MQTCHFVMFKKVRLVTSCFSVYFRQVFADSSTIEIDENYSLNHNSISQLKLIKFIAEILKDHFATLSYAFGAKPTCRDFIIDINDDMSRFTQHRGDIDRVRSRKNEII
jgi:hypothetical protein